MNLKTICSNFIEKDIKCEECLINGFDYQCKDIKLARGKLYSQQPEVIACQGGREMYKTC